MRRDVIYPNAVPLASSGRPGFTGAELLRLCAGHPELAVELATGDTQAGTPSPSCTRASPAPTATSRSSRSTPSALDGLDLVVPRPAPRRVAGARARAPRPGQVVVDLAADFRLQDPALYPTWYGEAHAAPELLAEFVYGLPELFRPDARRAPTPSPRPAATRRPPSWPSPRSCAAGLGRDRRASSSTPRRGVSGAGRPPKPNTTFCAVDEDFTAYGLLNHRHTPEIEQSVARGRRRCGRRA